MALLSRPAGTRSLRRRSICTRRRSICAAGWRAVDNWRAVDDRGRSGQCTADDRSADHGRAEAPSPARTATARAAPAWTAAPAGADRTAAPVWSGAAAPAGGGTADCFNIARRRILDRERTRERCRQCCVRERCKTCREHSRGCKGRNLIYHRIFPQVGFDWKVLPNPNAQSRKSHCANGLTLLDRTLRADEQRITD
jgi:hypothetical protein